MLNILGRKTVFICDVQFIVESKPACSATIVAYNLETTCILSQLYAPLDHLPKNKLELKKKRNAIFCLPLQQYIAHIQYYNMSDFFLRTRILPSFYTFHFRATTAAVAISFTV